MGQLNLNEWLLQLRGYPESKFKIAKKKKKKKKQMKTKKTDQYQIRIG